MVGVRAASSSSWSLGRDSFCPFLTGVPERNCRLSSATRGDSGIGTHQFYLVDEGVTFACSNDLFIHDLLIKFVLIENKLIQIYFN